jgi:hypothetical protein
MEREGWQFMLHNVDQNITCQMVQEDVQSNELFVSDTTSHVCRKAMLVFTVDCSVCAAIRLKQRKLLQVASKKRGRKVVKLPPTPKKFCVQYKICRPDSLKGYGSRVFAGNLAT